MSESKWLKKEDVGEPGDGTMVTIRGLKQTNVARDDDEPEMKWIIKFDEFNKPMVINTTNLKLAAMILGEKMTEKWAGKTIEVFHDPSVSFGDKLVGGIRFRKVGKTHARQASTGDDWGSPSEPAQTNDVAIKEQEITDAANNGTPALKTAWGGLTDAMRDSLRQHLPAFKGIAATATVRIAQAKKAPADADDFGVDVPF